MVWFWSVLFVLVSWWIMLGLLTRSNTFHEYRYKGEIGFFDFYIIPLAKKLKNCGVFGVSSDEYLNYAQKNRQEWEIRGQEIVASMVEKVKNKASSS